MKKQIKIIFADDHEIFRMGFEQLLLSDPDIHIMGQATTADELYTMVTNLIPEVVITGLWIPDWNGLEVAKKLRRELPSTGIIALSMIDNEEAVKQILNEDISGYISKSAAPEEILQGIHTVYQGNKFYCAGTREKMKIWEKENLKKERCPAGNIFTLTERAIIMHLCRELSTKEIAQELKMSTHKINWHRKEIMKKMGAKNVVGIVNYAREHLLNQSISY